MPKKDANILAVGLTLNGITYHIQLTDIPSIYFIEDIYSFFISGKMLLIDREGLFEFGPFTGTEEDGVKVLYSTDDDSGGYELDFKIFKIEKASDAFPIKTGTNNILQIIFVDKVFFKLTRQKWSRSFREKTIGEIIEHLCIHMLEIQLDVFNPPEQFFDLWYIPRWDINTCLRWLLARSSVGDDLSYLFYSNTKDGKFNYNCLSFNELLKTAPILDIDADGGEYIFDAENQYKSSKIKSWDISLIDESALKNLQGCFGFGYDFEKKKLIDSHDPIAPIIGETPGNMFYTYKDMLEKHVTVLGDKSLFHDISNPEAKFINYGESDPDIIKNLMGDDFVKRYNMQQLLTITVLGNQERYAGGMINVVWPSVSEPEKFNKNLKGLYLIKSITHSFQPKNTQCYTQKLVCIKNGYYDSDCAILEPAVQVRK